MYKFTTGILRFNRVILEKREDKNRFTHIMFVDTRTHQRVLSEPISIILPWESYESIDLW